MYIANKSFVLVFVVIFSCSSFLFHNGGVVFAQEATSDGDIFRSLYDKIADLTTTGVDLQGKVTQVLLMEMPGLSIRREDFDSQIWQSNNYVDSMPTANFARLVDRVPRYNNLAFTDSGQKISNIWNLVLRQFVVPLDLDPALEDLLALARAQLENSTLEEEVDQRFSDWRFSLESSLSNREACLANRDPVICSQQAVIWREDLRRSWYSLEVVKSQLLNAQSRLISLQTRDLSQMFTSALEKSEQQKRVDVGAVSYGEEFFHTTATPSNWWTWFPLDLSEYDMVVDEIGEYATHAAPAGTTISNFPKVGTAIFNTTTNEIEYQGPNSEFVGSDQLTYLDGDTGEAVTLNIAINGNILSQSGSQWASLSVTASDTQVDYVSKYSLLHRNNNFAQENSVVYRGSFSDTTLNTQSQYSFATGSFSIQFEIAKVQINRPWLDLSLFYLNPVGVRGIRQYGFSDGNPLFTSDTDFQFNLLPTHFLVARNIQLESSSITAQASTIQSVSVWSSSASVSFGPFTAGRSNLNYKNKAAHSRSRFTNGNTLVIDGPQIIGWICSPIPAFPSADYADIEALNNAQLDKYSRVKLTEKAFDNGIGVTINSDGNVEGNTASSITSETTE